MLIIGTMALILFYILADVVKGIGALLYLAVPFVWIYVVFFYR